MNNLADKLNAELETEFGPSKLRVAAPQTPLTTAQQVDVFMRSGPVLRQRIVADRAALTAQYEQDMARHIEEARSAADKLRMVYESRLAELEQLARRIGE